MRGILVLGLLFMLGCESEPQGTLDAGPDAGGDSGIVPDGGSNNGSDGGTQSGPILERAVDAEYDCNEALAVTRPVDRSWNGYGWMYGLAQRGSEIVFGRVERQGDPIGIPTNVRALVSTLASDGTYGTEVEIPIAMPDLVSSVAVATIGNDVMFAFTDDVGAKLARITGTTVDGPKDLISSGGTPWRIKIATKSDHGAILYASRGADNRIAYVIQRIDAAGAPTGSSYEIVRGARDYLDPGATIVPTANGWAVAWRNSVSDGGEIYFRLFGEDAQPMGDIKTVFNSEDAGHPVGTSVGFEGTSIALLPISGGGFLVGWVESQVGSFDANAWAMVTVAKLGADGGVIEAPAYLLDPIVDFDYVEPELFQYGDRVGLVWGRGTHIYICAGCVPDHSIQLVLLDPARMIPVSEVAEIAPDTGGLLYRSTIASGTDVLSAFRIVYHVSSEGGVAAFHCTAR